MTNFPRSPRLIKGAIIGLGPGNIPQTVVIFQYNPEKLSRRVEARALRGAESGDRNETLRLQGPPRETITLNIQIDGTDKLERQNPVTVSSGIASSLAALELLLYPVSKQIIAGALLAQLGVLEIIPPEAPMTLFVWGPGRVLPVRLSSMTINEEEFDSMLNPIRAEVDLSLDVLTTYDFHPDHPAYALYMQHQIVKEVLGRIGGAMAVSEIGFTFKL
jgi:hypothetical protein